MWTSTPPFASSSTLVWTIPTTSFMYSLWDCHSPLQVHEGLRCGGSTDEMLGIFTYLADWLLVAPSHNYLPATIHTLWALLASLGVCQPGKVHLGTNTNPYLYSCLPGLPCSQGILPERPGLPHLQPSSRDSNSTHLCYFDTAITPCACHPMRCLRLWLHTMYDPQKDHLNKWVFLLHTILFFLSW